MRLGPVNICRLVKSFWHAVHSPRLQTGDILTCILIGAVERQSIGMNRNVFQRKIAVGEPLLRPAKNARVALRCLCLTRNPCLIGCTAPPLGQDWEKGTPQRMTDT